MTEPKLIEQKMKLENGQYLVKKYLFGGFLGKGGFAKCYEAKDMETNERVAIKIISKDSLIKNRAKQKLLSQIKIHRALIHTYIVGFKSVFEDENNVYIVLELCTGRSLSQMVKKRKYLTCQETRYFILQLLSALQYLHANKVIHRDLKMANIFLSENMEIKLGDFGLSAKLQFCDERKRTMAGTPNYIAPEIIDGGAGHSYEVDLWSTGVICYALLFGRPPFQTAEIKMTYSRIKNCQYNFPSNISAPSSARDFIKKILVLDPKKRMTIAEMYQHPFLKGDRPRALPRSATDQLPVFNKQDLINEEITTNTNWDSTNSNILKVQSPRQTNILTNSNQINRSQNPSFSTSLNQKNIKNSSQKVQIVKNQPQNSPNQNKNQREIKETLPSKNLGVYVVSNVDYSSKYGLGYNLSNGWMGVYFNDSTVMGVDDKKSKFFYVSDPAHNDDIKKYNQADLPTDHNFTKKKMLLNKFQANLKDEPKNSLNNSNNSLNDQNVFIKQWLKTKHAIMFRLSNKLFQVDFFDHSQIILKTDSKQIKFKSKRGEQQFLSLSGALHQRQKQTQLGRRIKYTKQILNSLKRGQGEATDARNQ